MRIKFLVLACSYKHKERCVAGIDLTNKALIRLISENPNTNFAIPTKECFLRNRTLRPLDIIYVEIKGKAPILGAQSENYFVEFPLIREYIGIGTEEDIKPYRFKSTTSPYPFDSKAPFMSRDAYDYKNYSLCLVPAYSLSFKGITNSAGNNKTRVSFAIYKYNGEKVLLEDYTVTDPEYAIFDGSNKSGYDTLGKAYLLISLGPDDDSMNFYKYVSGIIDFTKRVNLFDDSNLF